MYFSFDTELASWKVCAQMNVGVMGQLSTPIVSAPVRSKGGMKISPLKPWFQLLTLQLLYWLAECKCCQLWPCILDIGYLDPLVILDNCHMCHSAQLVSIWIRLRKMSWLRLVCSILAKDSSDDEAVNSPDLHPVMSANKLEQPLASWYWHKLIFCPV